MLQIPSFRRVGDVTVYADDELWYRFYLLPSVPTVRLDENGQPVFLLIKYAFSEQDREADPNLPIGAGYVLFDVNLKVSPDGEEAAREELQAWVTEEYARRKADDAYKDLPEYQGPDAPQVVFADPTWAGGTAKMFAPQSEHLVNARVAEQPASLLHGNTAVFNMDLTAAGATMLYDLIVGEDGSGASDLTPLQVVYDMTMWARLPPVTIRINADSQRVYDQVKKIEETDRDNPCTPAEIETYRETGLNSATLEEQGVVVIQIDVGDATVPDDVIEELRQYALHLFDSMIERTMLEPAPQDDDELEFEDDLHADPEGHDNAWVATLYQDKNFSGDRVEITQDQSDFGDFDHDVESVAVRAGHKITLYEHPNYSGRTTTLRSSVSDLTATWNRSTESARIQRPPSTRYRVRKTHNEATMGLSIELSQRQVVEWPMVAQATLQTFFRDMSADEISAFARELRLDDPMFQTLDLTVRALADFEGEPISFVTVEVRYEGVTESFTFDQENPGAQTWRPSLVDGKRRYASRWRVGYDGHEATPWTEWERGTARDLNVAITDPGKLEVQVVSGSIDFDVVKNVTVTLTYADPEQGIEPLSHVVRLDAATPSGTWMRRLFKPVTQAIEAKTQFHLVDGKTIDGDAMSTRSGQLVVNTPLIDVLDVALVPSGDWSEVSMVVVQLEYKDAQGRVFDKQLQFSAMDQFATWKVLLQDPNRRTFRHKALIVYKTGERDDQPWQTATGDQAIPIHVPGVPKLVVNVASNLVDFTKVSVVKITLTRQGESKTLAFTEAGTATWSLPIPDGGDRRYSYKLDYHLASGEVLTAGPTQTSDTELYIPKPDLPDAGAFDVTVRGQLVDFSVTPLVEVVVVYTDPDGEEDPRVVTLSESEKTATINFEIADRTHRTFRYSITYFLPDGTSVAGDSTETNVPNIIVKTHQPS